MELRHEVQSALLAGVAALFSVANFFVFRPGLPKAVTLILAVSFGSYVIQWFSPVHDQRLTFLCVARLIGFSSLALLLWEEQRARNSER